MGAAAAAERTTRRRHQYRLLEIPRDLLTADPRRAASQLKMASMDMMSMSVPNYTYLFKFEEDFAAVERQQWMQKNWHTSFYYIGVYMVLIFGGQRYMATRERFELRNTLALWNFFLAVFSIVGAMRTVPELVFVLKNFGLHHSCCIAGHR